MFEQKTGTCLAPVLCLFLLVLASTSVSADASADPAPVPAPQADAQADPDAEADPQQYYRPPYVSPPIGSRPPYGSGGGSPPSACELTNQCCGLANQRCCLGGQGSQQQKCYTVWERKCDQEDNPECRVRLEQKCYTERVKDCRVITDITYRPFKSSYCVPKPKTQCFSFEKKVCTPDKEPAFSEISWENEKLVASSSIVKRFCTDVKTYNCTPTVVQESVTDKVRRPVVTLQTQKRCRMVQSVGQGQVIEVPVVKIVYKNVCYNVNVPQCSTNACGTGFCNQGQSVCSQNEFNTQTVCPIGAGNGNLNPAVNNLQAGNNSPQNVLVGQNCQQIREPICSGNAAGSTCNPGYQQCCSSTPQRICRQVPQRVVEKMQQNVPGQVSWKEECQDFPFNVTTYVFDDKVRLLNRTKQECAPEVKTDCHNFTIPQFEVGHETKNDRVSVMVPACKHRVVQDRYCHTFPTGELDCKETSIQRGFRINKIKCDRERDRQFCFSIPVADCRLGTNTNCRMVPRQVCQSTCSNDPLCSTCNQFVQGPGFGSCPSSTCGNFYPNDPWTNSTGPWDSGINELPWAGGNGGEGYYPGGNVGGEGYYPGGEDWGNVGGEEEYPGGSLGGEGYYPGGPSGGEGYYPGETSGGEGYFPGGNAGGEVFYPGGTAGGEGYFPGGSIGGEGGYFPGEGGENFYPGGSIGGEGVYPGSPYPGGSVGGEAVYPGSPYPGTSGGGVYYPGYPGYNDGSESLKFAEEAVKEEKQQVEAIVKDVKVESEQIKS